MSAGTASSKNIEAAREPPWLHVRREPFEYGHLPISSLIPNDVLTGLKILRVKLLEQAPPISTWSIKPNTSGTTSSGGGQNRVNTAGIAAALELTEAHAHLVLDTLASVLCEDGEAVDSLASTPVTEIDSVGADVNDLLLFLYIQTYRRVPSRPHRDATAVADVWPSTSAIDGFLPSPSPLQVKSPAVTRRSMPGQAEEEVNQLTYVQKHMPSLLSLLAETTEEGENSTKVITAEQFEHLGLLLKARNAGLEQVPLSEAAPFFANSDPDMPAAPVPVAQVLEWVQQHICAASENLRETPLVKDEKPVVQDNSENGPVESMASEPVDVTMTDATTSPINVTPSSAQTIIVPNGLLRLSKDWRPEGLIFVDGVMRASVMRGEKDIKGDSVKVLHCHDSVVYVLAPLKYVSVVGCLDSIIVLGAVGKAVRVEHCERIQLIVPTARICIANCRECHFYLGVNQRPLFTGDNHNLQVAPYNTYYPKLEAHLAQVGVDATLNRWDRILTLGTVDLQDTIIHPPGAADTQVEGAVHLPPEKFMIFTVPRWTEVDSEHQLLTRANPFLLPKPYLLAQQHRSKAAENLRLNLKNANLEDGKKQELTQTIHAHFRDWLLASGNIRQMYDLHTLDQEVKAME